VIFDGWSGTGGCLVTPPRPEGWQGWDAYAPFYDWENARTFGRRDVAFWRRVAGEGGGAVLELGAGTGRLLVPLARAGLEMVGLDRSAPMLARAQARLRRLPRARRPAVVQGDIRALPFAAGTFQTVLAPYGMLQSLLEDDDLRATLREARRVLRPGGLFGIDLVPDLPVWSEHGRRIQLRGTRQGSRITLFESVRQDRRRGLTMFDEQFEERRGRTTRRRQFTLTFRTRPLPVLRRWVERAGFDIDAIFGDYQGGPWTGEGADAWIMLARRRPRASRRPPGSQ
jgi:ubiquinone/menaquinone biosynthesis C-methylase UbiE